MVCQVTVHSLEVKRYSGVPMGLSSSIMNCTHLARRATEEHFMAAVLEAKPAPSQAGYYPESDGQPITENTNGKSRMFFQNKGEERSRLSI